MHDGLCDYCLFISIFLFLTCMRQVPPKTYTYHPYSTLAKLLLNSFLSFHSLVSCLYNLWLLLTLSLFLLLNNSFLLSHLILLDIVTITALKINYPLFFSNHFLCSSVPTADISSMLLRRLCLKTHQVRMSGCLDRLSNPSRLTTHALKTDRLS